MKTILVPTDLSSMTTYALDVAVGLARTYGAEIILLHTVVYPLIPQPAGEFTPEFSAVLAEGYENTYENAREAVHKLAGNPEYAGVNIKPKLGSSLEGLIRCINEQPADLIVLASKGVSGLQEWVEGSTAELIVRYAHCPVLVIKQPIEHFQPKTVICGIDVDERLKKLNPVPFQLTGQGLHHYVYVQTPTDARQPDGIRAWMDEYALAKGLSKYTLKIIPNRSIPAGILSYADDVKADLIVLFTHGYKGLQHWIRGSVAEDVLNHANIPVLIMRA